MALIDQMFTWFMTSGAYGALLPFFLIFTLIFAFLQKIKMFGSNAADNKRFNILIALIIALTVVVPHVTNSYPAGSDPITIVQTALPNVTLWIIAIFSIWLLLASFGIPLFNESEGKSVRGFVTVLCAIVVALIFGEAAGWWPPSISVQIGRIDPGVLQIILILAIVIGILIWLLGGEASSESSKDKKRKSGAKAIGDMFAALGGNDRE